MMAIDSIAIHLAIESIAIQLPYELQWVKSLIHRCLLCYIDAIAIWQFKNETIGVKMCNE